MTTIEILDALLSETGTNQKDFLDRIGANVNTFSDLRLGKVKNISRRLADKIRAVYPDFSLVWLLTGEGDMYNKENSAPVFQNSGDNVTNNQTQAGDINSELIGLLKKKDEQMDRLISVIERFSAKADESARKPTNSDEITK